MSFWVGRAKSGAAVRKILRACLLWCCVAAAAATCARGQTSVDGAISGFVVDARGAALVGATVQVANLADRTSNDTTTASKGEFLVGNLTPGEYRVVVGYPLFAQFTLPSVIVEVGAVTSVEVTLSWNVEHVAAENEHCFDVARLYV